MGETSEGLRRLIRLAEQHEEANIKAHEKFFKQGVYKRTDLSMGITYCPRGWAIFVFPIDPQVQDHYEIIEFAKWVDDNDAFGFCDTDINDLGIRAGFNFHGAPRDLIEVIDLAREIGFSLGYPNWDLMEGQFWGWLVMTIHDYAS
jgi:hypothetical protein